MENKKNTKNKKLFIILGLIVVAIVAAGIITVLTIKNKNADSQTEEIVEKDVTTTHNVYVKINPLVKIVYNETYKTCNDEICSEIKSVVQDFTLLNDDAKMIYTEIDIKGMDVYESIIYLINIAKEKNIDVSNVNLTYDSENFVNEKISIENVTISGGYSKTIDENNIIDNKNKYTVSFDSNGGTDVVSQIVFEGDKASEPAKPTKDGYTFVEWQLDGKAFDFNTTLTKDIKLIASWKKETTSSNNKNNSSSSSNNNSISLATPTLKNGYTDNRHVGFTNGKYTYDLSINSSSYYSNNKYSAAGYEVYEKVGSKYNYVSSGKMNGSASVEVEAGTKKVFVARVYQYNSSSNKVYSSYSKTFTIDKTTYTAPTLKNGYTDNRQVGFTNGKYVYDLVINSSDYCYSESNCSVAGYEIYEKVGTNYNYVTSGELGGAASVEVEAGTKKVFVARVYQYNSSNKKVYSSYSNELVIDKTTYTAPTLKNGYSDDRQVGFTNGKHIYDLVINSSDYCYSESNCSVAGYEIYEKVGTSYNYVASGQLGGAAPVEVEAGTKRTFVAKVYQYNSSGSKVYSSYSNELVIDKTTYAAPTLKNGYSDNRYVGFTDGKYTYDLAINSSDYCYSESNCIVAGYEIYEKVGTSYNYVTSGQLGGSASVEVDDGTKKVFVARVYQYNSSSNKVYSSYSNEFTIDKTN